MKKYLSASFILILVLICITLPASAASSVTEMPNVKIVIDGQIGIYEDTPINMNNRTLLPLRGILVNLGVKNDNEHIAWNATEKSVTVLKDSTKIYLKIGSNKAIVNGEEIALDASPVVYKSRTYIPVNFIAKSLGMKVVWDGSSKSVLIREQEGFNQIKDILEKSNVAMDKIENCKGTMDVSVSTVAEGENIDININMDMLVDILKKKLSMNMKIGMVAMNMNMDFYFADNTLFMKNPLTEKWEKSTLSESEYNKLFDDNNNVDILDESDALCAGLKEVKSNNSDEILLKGDVFLGDLMNMASTAKETDLSGVVFDKFNIEISIDRNTYRVNGILMDTSFSVADDEAQVSDMSIKCNYTDYNSDINIVVPADVIKSALDNPNLAESF